MERIAAFADAKTGELAVVSMPVQNRTPTPAEVQLAPLPGLKPLTGPVRLAPGGSGVLRAEVRAMEFGDQSGFAREVIEVVDDRGRPVDMLEIVLWPYPHITWAAVRVTATTDTQPVSLVADLLPDVTLTGVRSDPAWVELTVPLPAELGPDRPTLSAVVKVPAATVAGEYEVEITSHVRGLDESVRGTLEITVVQGPSLRFPQADEKGGLWDCGHTIPDVELSLALRAVNEGDEAVRILRADATLVTETSSNESGITIAIVSASELRIEAGAEAQMD